MRDTMPTVAAWVDITRETFCETPQSLNEFNQNLRERNFYAQENGKTIGKPTPDGVSPTVIDRSIDARVPVRRRS
jgi:hypothetical protein